MPTLPSVARKASRSSPMILIFLGGPSRSGSSSERSAGIQKRRSSAPIGVPWPLCVKKSLSALLSIVSSPYFSLWSFCCLFKRLFKIGDDVGGRLQADRESHDVGAGAGGDALLLGELAMRRRGRMDDQALGVADIGHVREEVDAVDDLDAGFVTALDAEGEDRTRALGQVLSGERIVLVRFQAGIVHPRHGGMLLEKFGHFLRVAAMTLHAQPQRLDAQHGDPGVEWRLRGAEIAQAHGMAVEGVGHVAEGLVEIEPMISRLGATDAGELAVLRPVEFP